MERRVALICGADGGVLSFSEARVGCIGLAEAISSKRGSVSRSAGVR